MNSLKDRLKEQESQQADQNKPRVIAPVPAIPAVDAMRGADTSVKKNLPYREINPKRCRRWKYHNRADAWLNRPEQESLIASIKRDSQLQLGLVRVVNDDPDIDHEIIFGYRRSEACKSLHISFKARILPADTADEVCAQYMHVENEESNGVSELENAITYKKLLENGVYPNQEALGKSLELGQPYISKLLSITSIFEYSWLSELVEPVIMDVSIRSALTIAAALKEPNSLRNMRNAANRLKQENTVINGNDIAKLLIGKTYRKKDKKKQKKVLVKKGRSNVVTLNYDDQGSVTLTVNAYDRTADETKALLDQIRSELTALL